MKVGIVLGNIPLEHGGGYNFEMEILRSILQFRSSSDHTFVLFSFDRELPEEIARLQEVRFVSLYRSILEKFTAKLFQIIKQVFVKLRHPSNPPEVKSAFEQFCLRIFKHNGIEFIIYLGQNFFTTFDIPYISIVEDLQHRVQPYFPEVSINGMWEVRERRFRRCLQRAATIVVGSQVSKDEVECFYQVPSDHIRLLPPPTPQWALDDVPDNDIQVLARYSLPEGYLFYPAQFWAHKNHAGLLRAIRLLREQYDLVLPVVFVGSDQGNLAYIKQLVAGLNLSDQIHFLGFVPHDALRPLYQKAFALAFVTFFGPYNLPPLEAFALGCPVVASNVPGTEEQLGDAALLVDPKDEQQIALAIKSIHDDPELRQTLIQRGLERASRWTGKDYAKGLFTILDDFAAIRRCWRY